MSERFRSWRQHVFVFIAVWALLVSAGCSNPFDAFLDDDDGPGPPPPSEFLATLSGDQEVPPVDTLASGEAVLTLNSNENMLNYEVTIADLPSNDVTQVNLNVAPPGFNGPIVFFLTRGVPPYTFPLRGSLTAQDLIPNANVSVETFAEFVDALRAGDVYVDLHTIQHPPGEIRGQAQGAATFLSNLDGGEEVPSVDTLASGDAFFTLDASETLLDYEVTIADLPSNNVTQVNLNVAPPGFNGPIVFFLTRGGPPFAFPLRGSLSAQDLMPNADVSVETFAEFVDAMKAGDVYVNVHTVEHPPGEIRGQVQGPATFVSNLDGEQEDPPVMTDASGMGQVVLSADRTTLRFALSVFGLAPDQITQAHIHVGEPGVNGPVVFFLSATSFTSPLTGTLTAADFIPAPEVGVVTFEDFLDVLFAGDTYMNVHTIMHLGGEVRGQLDAPVPFGASLDGEQEDPPVMTDATGTGQVVLSAERTTLRFALSVFDLPVDQITQAHIHVAPPGVNGPVVFFLSDMSFTSPRIGTLTAANLIPAPEIGVDTFEDFLDVLFAGDTYMNVHSVTEPPGEVRGQLEQ